MIPENVIKQINRSMADGERGALLLLSGDGAVAFRTQVGEGQYLGFDYRPDNYPSISGGIFTQSPAEFARSIQEHYGAWKVVKNNFDVPVDEFGGVELLEED